MKRALATLALCFAFTAPATATQPDPQPLTDHTAQWLTAVLGVHVPTQAVGSIDRDERRPWIAASYSDRGHRYILAEAWLVDDWARPRRADFDPDAGRVLIHELLHGVSLDEGAVDAVALDLLPAWMARFAPGATSDLRGVHLHGGSYPRLVQGVRRESARATRGGWRTRAARLWRRAHLLETGRR